MRFSLKEVLVSKHVKTKMTWRGTFCFMCGHKIWFETMYKVASNRSQCEFKYFCWDCCQSKEEAFDSIFPKQLTAQEIVDRKEKKKAWETLNNLLDDISNLPDGEVSPSVASVLLQYSTDIK